MASFGVLWLAQAHHHSTASLGPSATASVRARSVQYGSIQYTVYSTVQTGTVDQYTVQYIVQTGTVDQHPYTVQYRPVQ